MLKILRSALRTLLKHVETAQNRRACAVKTLVSVEKSVETVQNMRKLPLFPTDKRRRIAACYPCPQKAPRAQR
jgi:hypothetical protein